MNFAQIKGIVTQNYGKLPHPENASLVRACASDGIVLLKNDGVLPLKTRKVALLGAGAIDTMFCGTGSGYVFPEYHVTVEQGLKNAGVTLTSDAWLTRFTKTSKQINKKDKTLSKFDRMWSGKSVLIDEPLITE